jgi:hypothetical protein
VIVCGQASSERTHSEGFSEFWFWVLNQLENELQSLFNLCSPYKKGEVVWICTNIASLWLHKLWVIIWSLLIMKQRTLPINRSNWTKGSLSPLLALKILAHENLQLKSAVINKGSQKENIRTRNTLQI